MKFSASVFWAALGLQLLASTTSGFQAVLPNKNNIVNNKNSNNNRSAIRSIRKPSHLFSSTESKTSNAQQQLKNSVTELKKVLEREYLSFFNPMEKEWYVDDVTFEDPLTSLAGIQAYQNNVDMLSGRTLMGSILFGKTDARILLHKVEGGNVNENNSIDTITTRWTLQFTFQALPWRPVAKFSGISKYTVKAVNGRAKVVKQQDFWDSINLQPDGTGQNYQVVDKAVALQHFASLLQPGGLEAVSAGPEIPYTILRIGRSAEAKPMEGPYQVRRYPEFAAIQIPYTRRDEAFETMGSLTKGLNPLAPAIVTVKENGDKTMLWPLEYALPGKTVNAKAVEEKVKANNQYNEKFEIVTVPERVVAVGRFGDAIVEPIVRKVQKQLHEFCKKDGLKIQNYNTLTFAQYDAVFSMGKRRSEVHVELQETGHPW